MIPARCFECGKPAEAEHHVIPVVLGGTKTVPLCLKCHGLVHDRDFVRHRELQLKGIAKARAEGKFKGRKKGTWKADPLDAYEMRQEGKKLREIADVLGTSIATASNYIEAVESGEYGSLTNRDSAADPTKRSVFRGVGDQTSSAESGMIS